MKKVIILAVIILTALSSCSFETYSGCPAYSHHNKSTKYGQRAQDKYARRN